MQFRTFFLLFTFLFLSNFMGSCESAHLYRRKHFFCGNRLVDTLSKMCKTYNDPTGVVIGENNQAGIIETCCEQPCTLNVLATYCGTLKQLVSKDLEFHYQLSLKSYILEISQLDSNKD